MKYFTTDLYGVTLVDPDADQRFDVLETSEESMGEDYPDVYLTVVGAEPVLGYRKGGYLLWEEGGEVTRCLGQVDTREAARIWSLLVHGEVAALEKLPWEMADAED
jgi:hypothetical protein